ncbi:putative glycolipid-binding domain-containing protein [Dyella koreensis]|uniref:Glycolipid-binding domain-containing protein n=1 Tax=Dyella koreensis TaxID=311235 RepID=A0ABW8K396_9GAMM
MTVTAMWRRLDAPGHDVASLIQSDTGWLLRGTAIFLHQLGPASVEYSVDLDPVWQTRRGRVRGYLAGNKFDHAISREIDGWYLDGVLSAGTTLLCDLDFGFTPATNLQQLRRLALAPGRAAELSVAWFDIGATSLVTLPQRYERRGEASYWYEAPTVPYEGLLDIATNGFIKLYPSLWAMESS